jgi:hypothetical protein
MTNFAPTGTQYPPLAERLNDPQVANALHRLIDHAESFEKAFSIAGNLPNSIASAVHFSHITQSRGPSYANFQFCSLFLSLVALSY